MTTPSNQPQLWAKNTGGDFADFELVGAGTHAAICTKIVHIGTRPNRFDPGKKVDQVRITWELPNELYEFKKDGNTTMVPHVISETYTFSISSKSNLFKMIQAWRGKEFSPEEKEEFNIAVLAGVACSLTIIHKKSTKDPEKVFANVGSVAKLMKGMEKPKQTGESVIFGFNPFSPEIFEDKLSNYERKLIMESDEFKALKYTPKERSATNTPAASNSAAGSLEQPANYQQGEDEADDLPF